MSGAVTIQQAMHYCGIADRDFSTRNIRKQSTHDGPWLYMEAGDSMTVGSQRNNAALFEQYHAECISEGARH